MFVQIPGFPSYLVDECGTVVSMKHGKWKVLKPGTDRYGYLKLSLVQNAKTYSRTVHTLVSLTWLGARPSGLQVNHKDTNKLNNHVSNLEYTTAQQNTRHAWENGLCEASREFARDLATQLGKDSYGERNGSAKLSDIEAAKLLALKGSMTQLAAAQLFGISRTQVSRIWAGARRKHLQGAPQ